MHRLLMILLIFGLAFAWMPALAQSLETPDSEIAQDVAEEAPRTPRSVLLVFYEEMNKYQEGSSDSLEIATRCFDMHNADPVVAPAAARRLFAILDTMTFQFDTIPDEAQGRELAVSIRSDDTSLILPFRKGEDGEWRIALAKLDAALDALEKEKEEAKSEEPPSDETVAEFDARYTTPRTTIRTFLLSVNGWRETGMTAAIEAFDLSGIPDGSIRRSKGWELAVQLTKVLNRTMYIRFPEIPNDSNLPSYTLLQDSMGSVILAPVETADGTRAWKFTKASIDAIPLLYDYYANAPLVEGLKDEQLPELTSLWLRDMIRNNAPFLLKKAVLLENWQWIGLFVIILAGMAVGNLIILFTHHIIQHWFRRHKQEINPKVERDFNRPIRIAVTAWAWFIGLSVLGLPPAAMGYLGVGTKLLTGIAAVWAAYRFIDLAGGYMTNVTAKTESKYDDLLVPFITRCLKVFVITAGMIVIAETFEYDYMSLVAGLGIGGLAFALAAKDTVANLFGYITILTDRPFEVGDWITFGTADGSVESVGMRSTRIRTFHNSQVSVPNSEIINATIDNMGKRKYRRVSTTLSVAYDTPPEKIDAFCEGIRQIIREHPYTRKDFFHVYLNALGASSLNILLYCFHETPDWSTELRERHRLFLDILHLARSLGVEFAFPTQTLFVRPDQSPKHDAVPDSRPDAVRMGRSAAGDILDKGRPWFTPAPPPVSFIGDEDPDYLVGDQTVEGTSSR